MLKETVLLLMMIPSVNIPHKEALLQPVEAEAKPECHGDCDDKMVRILIGNEDGK
jgi:hypothetical protein